MPEVFYKSRDSSPDMLRYDFSESLEGVHILDEWVATCARSNAARRAEMLRSRVAVQPANHLASELEWFSQFTEPVSLITHGGLAWIEAHPTPPTEYGFGGMLIPGPGVWGLDSSCLPNLEPDAAASLTGFSEQIGGWMESKYFSGFYSIDPEPPIDETQPFKALQIASLSYYEDVWENTAEWRPAVAVYHDRSNGKVVIRRDGGCGYGAQGEEGFEHVRSSLGEFLRAYTSYWESGSSRPFNFYSIEW